jgi:hypothetical protein
LKKKFTHFLYVHYLELKKKRLSHKRICQLSGALPPGPPPELCPGATSPESAAGLTHTDRELQHTKYIYSDKYSCETSIYHVRDFISFSTLKWIKPFLRSTMVEKRLKWSVIEACTSKDTVWLCQAINIFAWSDENSTIKLLFPH